VILLVVFWKIDQKIINWGLILIVILKIAQEKKYNPTKEERDEGS
jgi:hypothetical protein